MVKKVTKGRKNRSAGGVKYFAIAFVAVFGLLAGITIFLVFPSGPQVYHFPENMTSFRQWINNQAWMTFIPYNAMTASAINVSAVVSAGLTSYNSFFLNVYQIKMGLTDDNLTFLASYQLAPPSPLLNGTQIIIYKPTPFAYSILLQRLNSSSVLREEYRGFTVYSILSNNTATRKLISGELFFYKDFIFYTGGSKNPLADIHSAIDYIANKYPSLFQNETIQRAVYAAMGEKTSFLGLFVLNFPVQVSGSEIASKAVLLTSKGFIAIYAVGFDSESSALQRFNLFKRTYLYGSSYYLIDNFDVANIPYSPVEVGSQLQGF